MEEEVGSATLITAHTHVPHARVFPPAIVISPNIFILASLCSCTVILCASRGLLGWQTYRGVTLSYNCTRSPYHSGGDEIEPTPGVTRFSKLRSVTGVCQG